MPEVTAEELFSKQGEKESLLVDSLREHAHYSKMIEGYPQPFSLETGKQRFFGREASAVGIFDFYESFAVVTKVNAAII